MSSSGGGPDGSSGGGPETSSGRPIRRKSKRRPFQSATLRGIREPEKRTSLPPPAASPSTKPPPSPRDTSSFLPHPSSRTERTNRFSRKSGSQKNLHSAKRSLSMKVYVAVDNASAGSHVAEQLVKSYKREDHTVYLIEKSEDEDASSRRSKNDSMVFVMKKSGTATELADWMVMHDKNTRKSPCGGDSVITSDSPLRGLEASYPKVYDKLRTRQRKTLERMGRRQNRRVRGITEIENPLQRLKDTYPKGFARMRKRQLEDIKVIGGSRALLQMLHWRHLEEIEDSVSRYLNSVVRSGVYTRAALPVPLHEVHGRGIQARMSSSEHTSAVATPAPPDQGGGRPYSMSMEESDPLTGAKQRSIAEGWPSDINATAASLSPSVTSPITSSLLESPGHDMAKLILGDTALFDVTDHFGGSGNNTPAPAANSNNKRGRRLTKEKRSTRLLSPPPNARTRPHIVLGGASSTLQMRAERIMARARPFVPEHLLLFDEPPLFCSPNGSVLRRADYHGTLVVVKEIPPDTLVDFVREVEAVSELHHPNIVGFMGALFRPKTVMLLEFCERGSLNHLLRNAPDTCTEPVMRSIMEDVARALAYVHTFDPPLIHRDIKSSNVLLKRDFTAKICDFGTATAMRGKAKRAMGVGTVQWMAPEVFVRNDYTTKADVYSYGVLLWEMMSKSVPYSDVRFFFLIEQMVRKGERPAIDPSWPTDLAKLMQRCWASDSRDRPTMLKVLSILRDHRPVDESSEDSSSATLDSADGEIAARKRMMRKRSTRMLKSRESAPTLHRTLSDSDVKDFFSSTSSSSSFIETQKAKKKKSSVHNIFKVESSDGVLL